MGVIDTLRAYMNIASHKPQIHCGAGWSGTPPAWPGASFKVLEGTQGIGVVLCETTKAAESVIEAFMGLKQNIMVQAYIKEAGGADIRCFRAMATDSLSGYTPIISNWRSTAQPDQDHP